MEICKIADCNSGVYCRGYCSLHYQKLKKEKVLQKIYEKRVDRCSVNGCRILVYAKGLCNKHWQRNKNNGSTDKHLLRNDSQLTVLERLSKNQITTENGCIEWTKQRDRQGYGKISINDYPHSVHRVAYEHYIGEIPENMHVLHKCDNPSCFNPNHLYIGTNEDNVKDRISRKRVAIGSRVGTAKLTEEDVVVIKMLLSKGDSRKSIADKYGVQHWTIAKIQQGKLWKHVK